MGLNIYQGLIFNAISGLSHLSVGLSRPYFLRVHTFMLSDLQKVKHVSLKVEIKHCFLAILHKYFLNPTSNIWFSKPFVWRFGAVTIRVIFCSFHSPHS